MEDKIKKLKELLAEAANLRAASSVLGWDQLVNMPEGGAADRGEQIATIESIHHQKSTADEVGRLLEDLAESVKDMNPDSDEARLVKVAKRDYDKQTKVPNEYVAEFARVSTVAQSVWEKAKIASDLKVSNRTLKN